MIGRVVSTKMNNTVAVLVSRVAKHPLYKKTFTRSKKYLVDAAEDIKEGDMVEIVKIRPVSKNKHWKVARVVGKSLAEINEEKLKAEAAKVIAEIMPEEKIEESSVVSPQTEEVIDKKQKPIKKKGKV